MGRPGRVKSKGGDASTSQDGETPKSNRVGKRGNGGRPKKYAAVADDTSILDSPSGSRASSPFSPANPRSRKRRANRSEARLTSAISDFDTDEDNRSQRLSKYLTDHPEARREYNRLIEERSQFPPWITEEDEIEHEGTIFAVGDIVCLFDEEDDLPYFAQIREMIRDQFKRPFVWVTWLAPRREAEHAHAFDPSVFCHRLIDDKLYPIESLRWECERPDEPNYQDINEHHVLLHKHRKEDLRQRTLDLFRAAQLEMPKGIDVIRAGDVRLAHSKHKDELDDVLKKAQKRDMARLEAMWKKEEEKGGEEEVKVDNEEEKDKDDITRFSSLNLDPPSFLSPSMDDLTAGETTEDQKRLSRRRKRGATASSQASGESGEMDDD